MADQTSQRLKKANVPPPKVMLPLDAEAHGDTERVTTVGAMVFGVEIGMAKLVKSFDSKDRTAGCTWQGSYVGTVRYYEEPFFGIFYDDGDFEEMGIEEMASCHCRQPDATAPIAGRWRNETPCPQHR